MGFDPGALPEEVLAFLAERHLATLSTIGPRGRLHVVAVGFAFDPHDGVVRIITGSASQKAANARRGGRAAVGQVDGARWLSLEGPVTLTDEPARVQAAVAAYSARYRAPGDNPARAAIEITVERVLGRV